MHQPKALMTKSNLISNTYMSKQMAEHYIELGNKLKNDPDKKDRLAKQECPMCFYSSRLGGAAITERPCMCCGEVRHYASTATDKLCKPCAQKHSLCKHCGGDIDMRVRRREWPEDAAKGERRGHER